ncbi:MAG: hypothetical protein ACI9MR_000011 [Myxococcota bacterium]|jgi:hypothetical protein
MTPTPTPERNESWRAQRWRKLAEWEFRWDEHKARPDFSACVGCTDPARCASRSYAIPPLKFGAWPACPVRLTSSPQWRQISRLYSQSKVSALSDWPASYLPFVQDALTAFYVEEKKHESRAIEESKASSNGFKPHSQNHTQKRAYKGPAKPRP